MKSALVTLLGFALLAGTGFAQPPGCAWHPVEAPDPDRVMALMDVVALASDDVWAVGRREEGYGSISETLTMHFDGDAWSVVDSPSVGTDQSSLGAVTGPTGQHVWAVGTMGSALDESIRGLVLRHRARGWNVVPLPSALAKDVWFHDVVATRSGEVWVVGRQLVRRRWKARIIHFDGDSWSRVRGINRRGHERALFGATAVGPRGLWAVGVKWRSSRHSSGARNLPLLMSSDGRRWQVEPALIPDGSDYASLRAVAGTSADDVWAIGHSGEMLIEHYDGHKWSVSAHLTPSGGGYIDTFEAVAAVSPTDARAVGNSYSDGEGYRPVIFRWDGSEWSEDDVPTPAEGESTLSGVSAAASNDFWAVGSTDLANWYHDHPSDPGRDALILHYSCD